jgi:hypothetical protein
VKLVKGQKKRYGGRKPAAGRREEPKELIRSDCGTGKKLGAACRKVSSCATVAWRKRNLFKKFGTQGNCGQQNKLTAAGIKTTHHAEVAWRKRNSIRKDWTMDKVEREAQRARMLRRRKETTDAPGKRQGNKGPGRQTAAISEEKDANQGWLWRVQIRTQITSGKQRNSKEGPL